MCQVRYRILFVLNACMVSISASTVIQLREQEGGRSPYDPIEIQSGWNVLLKIFHSLLKILKVDLLTTDVSGP